MKKRCNTQGAINEKRLLSVQELCAYLNIGRNRGIEFAKDIGAERRMGRRCLYDRAVIDKHLDEQGEENVTLL